MATRYKGYKSLNKMIEELENTVITVNLDTGEPIKPNIVTRKSISDIYSSIIDKNTGKFLSYQEAKNKVMSTSGQSFSFGEYQAKIQDFQDKGLMKQLTLKGEMEYQIERGIKVFGEEMMDKLIDRLGYPNYRLVIDTIGRLSNDYKENSSNYASTNFYDMIAFVLQGQKDGIDINEMFSMTEQMYNQNYTRTKKEYTTK